MSILKERRINDVIVFVIAVIVIASYFIIWAPIRKFTSEASAWGSVIAGFTMFVGAVSAAIYHINKVIRREEAWWLSAYFVVMLAVMFLLGIGGAGTKQAYSFIFTNIYKQIGTATSALGSLFLITAFYRSFRMRSIEAGIVVVSAVIVGFTFATVAGGMSPFIKPMGVWLLTYPTMAAMRGIMMCIAIGAVAISLRVVLGLERGLRPIEEEMGP